MPSPRRSMKRIVGVVLSTWGWITLGGGTALLYVEGCFRTPEDVLAVVMMPFFALATAVVGPLSIVSFALYLCRILGGTTAAQLALTAGIAPLYFALSWCVNARFKTTKRGRRLLWGIALMVYSAVAAFCLMYVSSRI